MGGSGWQGADRKVTQWTRSRVGGYDSAGAERGPSAGEGSCQHKLAQVVLAPGLEQHGAVFSLLCSIPLHWDNVRFLILYTHRRIQPFNFFYFFFLPVLIFAFGNIIKPGQQIFFFGDKFSCKGCKGHLWVTRAPVIVTGRRENPWCAAPTFNFLQWVLQLWAARSSWCGKSNRETSRAGAGGFRCLKPKWQMR